MKSDYERGRKEFIAELEAGGEYDVGIFLNDDIERR